MLNRLSIKTGLVLILLLYSLLAILVMGVLSWWTSRTTLTAAIVDKLVTVREAKAEQIQSYFFNLGNQISTLRQDGVIVEATVRFNRAFRQLESQQIPDEWNQGLEAFYTTQYLPKLFETLPGQADYALYRPNNQAALYLQYQYIVANNEPPERKILLEQASDGSEYSEVHARFHPHLSDLVKRLGFADLLLVNINTGDVVYSAAKEVDFANNVFNGPFDRSNLTTALEAIRNNPDPGNLQSVDYELYRPSYGRPTAFVAAPIYNGAHPVGILVLKISPVALNQLMTFNQNWQKAGLGATGETYLVGPDLLMRSDSRFLLEDPTAYLATLRANGVSERNLTLISKTGSSTFYQRLASPDTLAVTQGQEGTQLLEDYRGQAVIASFQPIQVAGNQWGLVAKVDQAEAFQPLYTVQNRLLIAAVILATLFAFSAIGIAYLLIRPIERLVQQARAVRAGDLSVELHTNKRDEIGELTQSFMGIVQELRNDRDKLTTKERTIEHLLRNLAPTVFMNRLKQLATNLVEEGQQVTVLYGSVVGLQALGVENKSAQLLELLNDFTSDLDEAAERYDVEKFTMSAGLRGTQLVAICGLSTPHLDHARRMANFALTLQRIAQRLQTKYSVPLHFTAGMHTGAVTVGIVGQQKYLMELWGETVNSASDLQREAATNTVLVSQRLYDRLHEFYAFKRQREERWTLESLLNSDSSPTASAAANVGQSPNTPAAPTAVGQKR
jgi:class 3 adenylate cyclase